MPKQRPFPSKEADLNLNFQAAVAYLLLNHTRLLVSAANQALLTTQLSSWNLVFPNSQNANTRTKSVIDNKEHANEALISTLRAVYADISSSVLTIEDRNSLNLSMPSTTRSAAPVPSSRTMGQVDTSNRLALTVSFAYESGATSKRDSVRGCQIWFKISVPAIDPSKLSYMTTDTASPYTYEFNGSYAGKNVYCWLLWENNRGETGPRSNVVMATITG